MTDHLKQLDAEYDHVFIIDVLPEQEYERFKISQDLMQFLANNGIPQKLSICRNKKLFLATMQYLVRAAAKGEKFALHFVGHGNEQGIGIKTTNEFLPWEDYRMFLNNINSHMNGNLLVNMTSCKGLHGIKIVDVNTLPLPFFGLIGCSKNLKVSKGKQINQLFYYKIIEGK
jgi:hypothetical protein